MLARILFLTLLVPGTTAFAAGPTTVGQPVTSPDGNHFSQTFSRGKEVVVVDVRVRPFQKARHKLRLLEGSVQKVDDRNPFGIDGGPPEGLKSEIVSISVAWNGIRRNVDKRLYSDCFNVSALPYRVLVSEDFNSVMITAYGGDGGGAYGMHWVLPKDGDIVRFILGTDELTWRLPIKALQRTTLARRR